MSVVPESFWATCRLLLSAKRGHEDPRLQPYLERDPTIGLPPDVRRALLLAAEAEAPDLVGVEIETIPLLRSDAEGYAGEAHFQAIRKVGLPTGIGRSSVDTLASATQT